MKLSFPLLSLVALWALAPLTHLSAQDAPAPAVEAESEPAASGEKPAETKPKPKEEKKPYQPYIFSSKPGAAKVRLFILSGQSNMHYLKPDTSFTPAVAAAFPDDDVVVVKDAEGGQPLRRWLSTWKPAEGMDAPKNVNQNKGTLYKRLKTSIATALEGKPTPVSVSFVWMQGEADTGAGWSATVYEKSLKDLIELVRKDMNAPKMPVVIGRINDCVLRGRLPENWEAVRAAQVAVAESDGNAAWVDTDALNGPKNDLHFPAAGYTEMGKLFAEKSIELLKTNEN